MRDPKYNQHNDDIVPSGANLPGFIDLYSLRITVHNNFQKEYVRGSAQGGCVKS